MSGVRGPNSALTEFLRSQGINATEIRRRYERQRQRESGESENDGGEGSSASAGGSADGTSLETTPSIMLENPELEEDPELARIAQAAAKKKRGHIDDLSDAQAANVGTAICAICNSRFTLTVYSKEAPGSNGDQFLCRFCSAQSVKDAKAAARARQGVNKVAARKQRKKLSAELLNLRFLIPPSLQDICTNIIVEHIDSIQELGELTVNSLNKISRILGKIRRLTPQTAQLFLRNDVTVLEFWDCSKLVPEAFNLIPAMCPNLEHLVLGMCGQLNDDNLNRIAQLRKLKVLHLDGPFMIRKEAWMNFIDTKGPDLTQLTITSVYRVDAEVLALLAETCMSLEFLRLKRLTQLIDPTPFYLLGDMINLKHLELVELEPEVWSDDCIVHILNMIGSQLESLVLVGAEKNLGDRIVEAIGASCTNLSRLELVNLTGISDEAVEKMFKHWDEGGVHPGLQTLSLERCFQVGDDAIRAAIKHCGATLVNLNINSLRQVEASTIEELSDLPNLTTLDIGFLNCADPKQIYKLSTSKSLRHILAFGNIRLSGMPLPTGLTVVGTM